MSLLRAAALLAPVVLASQSPTGSIVGPMILGANQTAYYAEVQVGTPPQKNYLR